MATTNRSDNLSTKWLLTRLCLATLLSTSLKRLPAPGAVALVFEKKKGHTAAGLHGILTRFPFHRTVEGCETVVGAKIGLFVLAKNFLQHFF